MDKGLFFLPQGKKRENITEYLGLPPFPATVANEGLFRDPLLKMILSVTTTGKENNGTTQMVPHYLKKADISSKFTIPIGSLTDPTKTTPQTAKGQHKWLLVCFVAWSLYYGRLASINRYKSRFQHVWIWGIAVPIRNLTLQKTQHILPCEKDTVISTQIVISNHLQKYLWKIPLGGHPPKKMAPYEGVMPPRNNK